MTDYIKTVFTKPKEIYTGRNMKNTHFFYLLLLLTLILTFFSLFEFVPAGRELSADIQEIKSSIPEFELVDNELDSETESYIYQTDSMLLYFDPQDKMSTDTIDKNMNNVTVPLSIGLMNDQMYLNVIGQNYSIHYSDLSNFTTSDLQAFINNFGRFSPGMIGLFVVFIFFYNFLFFISQLFPIVLFANLISVYRKTGLRFVQTMKVAFLATILPTLVVYGLHALVFPVSFQFEIILGASLVLYYMSMTEMKERFTDKMKEENSK